MAVRRLISVVLGMIVVASLVALSPSVSARQVEDASAGKNAAPLLFSVELGPGEVRRGQNGTFRLRAEADTVVWFTDRPGRAAGVMSPPEFVRKWAGYGFRSSPPNAALIANGRTEVFVLSQPRILGSDIAFTARPLSEGRASRGIAHHAARAQTPTARSFTAGSLFIDDASDCSTEAVAAVVTAVDSAHQGVDALVDALESVIAQELADGVTPTQTFEEAFEGLVSALPDWDRLGTVDGAPDIAAVIGALGVAHTGVEQALRNGADTMTEAEINALTAASTSLNQIVASLTDASDFATATEEQCSA